MKQKTFRNPKQFRNLLLLALLLFCSANVHAATYYWIGGSGNWSDLNHWSFSSGGTTYPTGVPTTNDDVVFDVNSGLANFTVTISAQSYCKNMTFTADSKCTAVTMNVNGQNQILTIAGSLQINNTLAFGRTGTATDPTGIFFLSNTAGNIVHLNGNPFTRLNVTFSGTGSWMIDGNFKTTSTSSDSYASRQGNVTLTSGATVNLSANTAFTVFSELNIASGCTFNFANCAVTSHRFINANLISVANSTGSTITVNTLVASGWSNTRPAGAFSSNTNSYFDHLVIANTDNTQSESLSNGHYKSVKILTDNVAITTIETDTLIINPVSAGQYTFASTTSTVNNQLNIQGQRCGGLIKLAGISASATSMNIKNDDVTLANISATNFKITKNGGTANYTTTGIDNGGNTGLTFTSLSTQRFYWIGGTGQWDEPAHWSYFSGGSSANCIPSAHNTVVFDKNSGLGSGKTVSVPAFSYCDSLIWKDTETDGTTFDLLRSQGITATTGNANGLFIDGSLLIQSKINITGRAAEPYSFITFTGSRITPESIQTNGCKIPAAIWFDGSGYWQLADDITLILTRDYYIRLVRGNLNTNGKTVFASAFWSEGSQLRTLDISNSLIQLQDNGQYTPEGWVFTGSNATVTTTNSKIQITNAAANGGVPTYFSGRATDDYNLVEAYGQLGNFGTGKFKSVRMYSAGMNLNAAFVADSLFLMGDGNYNFAADINVNKELQIKGSGNSCGGFIGINSTSTTANRTITMGSGSNVTVSGVLITRVNIDGPDKPYTADDSSDGDTAHLSTGWNFTTSGSSGTTFYWIGGAGNWNDPTHWSTISGTPSGNTCTPSMSDNVVFDGGSGLSGSKTVTINVTAACNNMTWQGPAGDKPVLSLVSHLYIYGSLMLQSGMSIGGDDTYAFNFRSTNTNNTITTNGVSFICRIYFNSTGGWKLMDNINMNRFNNNGARGIIYLDQGHLDLNGKTITANSFIISSTATNANSSLNMAGAKLTFNSVSNLVVNTSFQNASTSFIIDDASTKNSTIIVSGHFYPQTKDTFNIVISNYREAIINAATFHYLSITAGTNNLGAVVADTLIFNPSAYPYKFRSSSTITANKAFIPNGTPCTPTEIQTTSTAPASLQVGLAGANLLPDTLLVNFVRIRNITAISDGIDWCYLDLGENSPRDNGDGHNLANWILDPYVGAGVSTGLGPDRNICTLEYLLNSARFAPTPNASFVWKRNGTTVSTDPTYLATSSGTYSLTVNYAAPNGTCTLSDDVNLVFASTVGYWKGTKSSDWNDPLNWSATADGLGQGFIPTECTEVHILSGKAYYPDLDPAKTSYTEDEDGSPVAACLSIYFEPGAEVARTDSLHYSAAYVQMKVNSNQWYMITPPLRDFYSGDYYFNDPNPFQDSHFVETMLFNVTNPETGQVRTYDWSGRFATADILLNAGRGMAIWADDKGTSYSVHTPTVFSFPKPDTYYIYYSEVPPHAPTITSPTFSRTNSKRFIYEPLAATGRVPLAASPVSATGQPVLIGNPFMAHLDADKFITENTTQIYSGYKLSFGVNTGADGVINDLVSYQKVGETWFTNDPNLHGTVQALTSAPLIAPMQSFIVISKVAGPSLSASIKSTQTSVAARDTLRSAPVSDVQLLDITAIRGEETSKALLLTSSDAGNAYNPGEDSYKLFLDDSEHPETLQPLQVYTRSTDGYALDINTIKDFATAVPVSVRTSLPGTITLQFSGMDSFNGETLYFHDMKAGSCINLSQEHVYSFIRNSDEALYLNNRFYISNSPNAPTGLQQPETMLISITGASQAINLLSLDGTPLRNIQIVDMQGRYLLKANGLAANAYRFPVTPGIYLVIAQNDRGTETKKVIVK